MISILFVLDLFGFDQFSIASNIDRGVENDYVQRSVIVVHQLISIFSNK